MAIAELVDGLKASRHANMKELRFSWEGKVWRVAFAFDRIDTHCARPSCWSGATRPARISDGFTNG